MVLAELSLLTGAPDTETQIARLFRNTPGLTTSPLLKPETHRTSYAYLLMKRGERAQASELLAESLKQANGALADGNEGQRVPVEMKSPVPLDHDAFESSIAWPSPHTLPASFVHLPPLHLNVLSFQNTREYIGEPVYL